MTSTSGPNLTRLPRRIIGMIAAGALTALLLGACSGEEASPDSTGSTGTDQVTTTTVVVRTSMLQDVKISGDTSSKPTVEFEPAFAGQASQSDFISRGDGPAVSSGWELTLDYLSVSGATGEEVGTTWGSTPVVTLLGTLPQELRAGLEAVPIGSRVAISVETEAGWLIYVIDLKDARQLPTRAEGEPVTPPPGLPTVTEENGVPTVTLTGGAAPADLIIQPLIKGSGPEVKRGQTVTVQYVGVKWSDGQIFDSSWDRGENGEPVAASFVVDSTQVIAGFADGLAGQTVGSRVMLIIPPDQGYGGEGNTQSGIAGTETLVFVIDILATS